MLLKNRGWRASFRLGPSLVLIVDRLKRQYPLVAVSRARFLGVRIIGAFRKTMNAALRRAKEGEDRASEEESIVGDLIKFTDMRALNRLLAKMSAARSAKANLKVKQGFYLI